MAVRPKVISSKPMIAALDNELINYCLLAISLVAAYCYYKFKVSKNSKTLLGTKSKLAVSDFIIKGLDTPILVLDNEYLILYSNEIFRTKFNTTLKQYVEGLHICALMPREFYLKISDLVELATKSENKYAEKNIFSKDAKDNLTNYTATLKIRELNKKSIYIIFFQKAENLKREDSEDRDELLIQKYLSELEHSRIQLKKQSEELAEARDKALQATNAKSSFLANMSHEIRTPMNGLIGVANLLTDTELTEQQRNYVDILQNCADSLLILINDILDFSKIEAGKMSLSPVCVDLHALLNNCSSLYKFPLDTKRIKLEINLGDKLPRYVIVDNTRLQQIINNLLSNAIKFTPEDGIIKIDVRSLGLQGGSANLEFSVTDNGIGISKEAQKRIFEAFEQADSTTTRKYGGTGLGLSICNALVKLMKGNIWVEGEENKGASFKFTISLDLASPVQIESLSVKESFLQNIDPELVKRKLSILIAEDNITNQKIITSIVEKMGHEVVVVGDGKAALDAIHNNQFNLVLMDGQMPVMDGYEATKQLRLEEIGTDKRLPVIAVTANAMKDDHIRCKEAGMDDYISKPIDRRKLFELIIKHAL